MKDTVVVTVYNDRTNLPEDIEIPLDISANDLIIALSEVYGLKIKKELMFNYYIRCDEPKALLMGENSLEDYGIRDGSKLWLWK